MQDKLPNPPQMLNELGQAEYDRIVKALIDSGRPSAQTDFAFVLEYAHSYQCYVEACQEATRQSLLAISEKGVPYIHPIHGIVSQYRKAMNEAAAKLGLAPADRKKVLGESDKPKKVSNPLELLKKPPTRVVPTA
tara:strand:+ start:66 stop:470 length:405 start_codon:yes stop_codon:yes gene_type:complete